MSVVFLDTNALFKLYVAEVGSSWLQTFITNHTLVISELALFECAAVLRRRELEGRFTHDEAVDLFGQIRFDSPKYQIIPLGGNLQLDRMADLTFHLPNNLRLRSLDGIHLAAASLASEAATSALPPQSFVFITSDRQLLAVAQAQGFMTENPEDHP